MNCDEVRERLPWLENGSLDAAEARAVEEHLADCPECQAERAETRIAGGIFATAAHPSVAELVAYRFDDASPEQGAVIAAHLEKCAECRDEAALVAESAALVDPGKEFGGRKRGSLPRVVRTWAIAASFLAFVSLSGWLWTLEQLRQERRVEPRTDLAVVELMSAETVLRSPGSPRSEIARDRDATLILVADTIRAGERYSVRVEASGLALWEGPARAASANELTLYLPAGALPAASCVIRVVAADGSSVASFELDVR